MNIEDWIEDNSELADNCFSGERLIHPESIKELLKTHAIVPREPSDEKLKSWKASSVGLSTKDVYKKLIEVMGEE